MKTNKPEVLAYHINKENPEHRGVTLEPLVRLSDYEALQADYARGETHRNDMADQIVSLKTEVGALKSSRDQLRKDAEIGKIVWKFIDRMNDTCPQFDSADRIITEFIDMVNPIIDAAIAGGGNAGQEN